jgi:hypothetical protein
VWSNGHYQTISYGYNAREKSWFRCRFLVTGAYHVPVGIVTKADFVSAYQQGLTLDSLGFILD